jgi:solute carrier family 6 GABA transporter-like protein 1
MSVLCLPSGPNASAPRLSIAQLLSLIVGHSVSVPAGAGVGFGVFAIGSVIAVVISKTPDVQPNARLFKKVRIPSIVYYLAFYSVSF